MRTTLLGLGIAVTAIPVIAMFVFIKLMGADVATISSKEIRSAAIENAKLATADMRRMCDAVRLQELESVDSVRSSIMTALTSLGDPSLAEVATPVIVRDPKLRDSEKTQSVRLLKFGDLVANPQKTSDASDKITALFNRLKEAYHCDIALYVNDSSGMLALAGTMLAQDGANIAGTYYTSVDGLEGNAFLGYSESALLNRGVESGFIPIPDASGEIIGAIRYSMRRPVYADVEDFFKTFRIGERGTAWVVDNSNPVNPTIKYSSDAVAVGMAVADDNIKVRAEFFKRALEKVKTMRSTEVAVETIVLPIGEMSEATRLLTYTYYKPWNWLIGTTIDEREFQQIHSGIQGRIEELTSRIILTGIIFTCFVVGIAWVISGRMARPIRKLVEAAREQSKSNMQKAEEILKGNSSSIKEFAELSDVYIQMTQGIALLLGTLKQKSIEVSAEVNKISENISVLEGIAFAQSSSMKSVATASSQILSESETLNKNARASAFEASATVDMARSSGESLSLLTHNYNTLDSALKNLQGRLISINSDVEKITSVVAQINDLSNQTNLLSLNASIEAEKAGEYGRGFAVVSRQIRRLADNTTLASANIDEIVRQIQSAVGLGAKEMDKFGAKMHSSAESIISAMEALTAAVSDIKSIGPKFEAVAVGISALSENARLISSSMLELNDASTHVCDRIIESRVVVKPLASVADTMVASTENFKLGGRK